MLTAGAWRCDAFPKSDFHQTGVITSLHRLGRSDLPRREAELLMQLQASAAAIGDTGLESSFKETLSVLQRGLPFSASLYL